MIKVKSCFRPLHQKEQLAIKSRGKKVKKKILLQVPLLEYTVFFYVSLIGILSRLQCTIFCHIIPLSVDIITQAISITFLN